MHASWNWTWYFIYFPNDSDLKKFRYLNLFVKIIDEGNFGDEEGILDFDVWYPKPKQIRNTDTTKETQMTDSILSIYEENYVNPFSGKKSVNARRALRKKCVLIKKKKILQHY